MNTLKTIFYKMFGEDEYGKGLDQIVNVILFASFLYISIRVVL